MEYWIRNNFDIQKPFPFDEHEYIVFEYESKENMIPLRSLLKYVESLEAPLTHAKLKSVDPTDKAGWHKYFDDWKEKGILN